MVIGKLGDAVLQLERAISEQVEWRERLTAEGRLRQSGTAVLLVEQLIEKALAVSDRVYALAQGRVVLESKTGEPDLAHQLERAYLGQKGR